MLFSCSVVSLKYAKIFQCGTCSVTVYQLLNYSPSCGNRSTELPSLVTCSVVGFLQCQCWRSMCVCGVCVWFQICLRSPTDSTQVSNRVIDVLLTYGQTTTWRQFWPYELIVQFPFYVVTRPYKLSASQYVHGLLFHSYYTVFTNTRGCCLSAIS